MHTDVKVVEYFHAKVPQDTTHNGSQFTIADAVQYIRCQLALLADASNDTGKCFIRYMDLSTNRQSFHVEYGSVSKEMSRQIASISGIEEIKLYLYYQVQNEAFPELCPTWLEEKLKCADPGIFDNLVYGIDVFPISCTEHISAPRGYYKHNGQIHRGDVTFCVQAAPSYAQWHSVNMIADLVNYPCTENEFSEIEPILWNLGRFEWYCSKLYTPEEIAAEKMVRETIHMPKFGRLEYHHGTVVIKGSQYLQHYADNLKKLSQWCKHRKAVNRRSDISGTVHPAFFFSHSNGLQMMIINPNVQPMQILVSESIQGDFE